MKIVSSAYQEVNGKTTIVPAKFYLAPIRKYYLFELFCPVFVPKHLLFQLFAGVEAFFSILEHLQGLDEFISGHFEGDQSVRKGEHVIKMLKLKHARVPDGPEPSWIHQDEVVLGVGHVHQISDQISKHRLTIELSFQDNLVQNQRFKKVVHLGEPLRIEQIINSLMSLHFLTMELPLNQRSCRLKLEGTQIFAIFSLFEYFFADRNRAFYLGLEDLFIVEVEV